MHGSSQRGVKDTELALDLLSTPFEIQTNWHVITGAPSCGKTTLIELLAGKGFRIVPECARQYMERELAEGRSVEEIHKDAATLQRTIANLQLRTEGGLRSTDVLFLDGALPGSLAWYRCFGLNPNEILPYCFRHRYASVFVLDLLPHQADGLRFEDESMSKYLDAWIERDYIALGYEVVRVPALAPEERLAIILER
jgi:predicted ATPase